MTTKVVVDAHAGWPVEVTTIDKLPSGDVESKTIVPPLNSQEFYATDSREIHVKELPRQ